MINNQTKRNILHLNQVLVFLKNNVQQDGSYLLRRHRHNDASQNMGVFLYEVDNQNDINSVEFVPHWMLAELQVSNA